MSDDLPMMQVSGLQVVAIDDLSQGATVPRDDAAIAVYLRRAVLGLILVASAFLNFFSLGRLGYGNAYYAAGVKSMLMSWHNLFFVSFDPGGFVTIDKPPLGFWLQAASAEIFGFHGWSLILPEALAGIGSVALVYLLVRRVFGELAGLLGAAVMAVTPVAVATNRSNIVDSLLVFTLLLGAWAVLHATDTGKLRWLLASMLLVGLGFNIKMLEAYLVVPAFIAVYFLGAKIGWRTKIWHLALAGVVLLVVSLSWATAVDLTPANQRPYVGSSDNNSEYNLIFGYNGLNRLLSGSWSFLGLHGRNFGRPAAPSAPTRNTGTRFGFGAGENGASGPLRLINQQLGGQSGWLLLLALIGIVAAGWQLRPRLPFERHHASLLFWGVWLLTGAGFFSVAGFFHSYYLVMMAPPIAALSGIGLAAMWHDYRGPGWRGWLLPFALVGVALVQRHILSYFTTWHPWVSKAIVDASIAIAVVLLVLRAWTWLSRKFLKGRFTSMALRGGVIALGAGILAIGLAPTAWAADTTLYGNGGLLPTAGPSARGGFSAFGGGRGGFRLSGTAQFDVPGFPNVSAPGDFPGQTDPLTLQYLLKNQGSTKFLVATTNANTASPIILATGKPVMALGGFTGSDPILSIADLQKLIANNTVRFFMLQGGFGGFGGFGGGRGSFGSPSFNRSGGDNSGGFSFREPGAGRFGEPGQFQTNSGNSASPNEATTTSSSIPGQGLAQWVMANCKPVNPSAINGTQSTIGRGAPIYDCKP